MVSDESMIFIHRMFTVWMIHPDGYITDQGGNILTHNEKNELLDKINSFYFSFSDEEIQEANSQPIKHTYNSVKPKSKAGVVYLLCSENGLYKIGMTTNLKTRLKSMKGSPVKINLIHSFESDNALESEQKLHSKFASYRVSGEWFKLNIEQVKEICQL